jgi:tetratricopeptide (TPR) repeat protein
MFSLSEAGLKRLEALIERCYPSRSHSRIYTTGHGRKYNVSQLCKYLDANVSSNPSFGYNRDTLQKILDRRGTRKDPIFRLFESLGDSISDTDLSDATEVPIVPKVPKDVSSIRPETVKFCNLPRIEFEEFIGRTQELERLMNGLDLESRSFIITVHGFGGVGKTAIALEAAYRCLRSKHQGGDRNLAYDAIVFVNFKQDYLYPNGLISRARSNNSALEEVFRTIAEVLEDESVTRSLPEEQQSKVVNLVRGKTVLIVLDDLQSLTTGEEREIQSFLEHLPAPSKVIITTRELRCGNITIQLNSLNPSESYEFVSKKLEQIGLTNLSEDEKQRLCKCYWYVPQAMVYAIGQLNNGFDIDQVLGSSCPVFQKDATKFCFEKSMSSIHCKTSYYLLLAATVFQHPPKSSALIEVSGISETASEVDIALSALQRLSLLKPIENSHGRFSLDPMTREYTFIEFEKNPEIRGNMQTAWIKWCLRLTEENGGPDWGNWHIRYDCLQEEWENILSVLNWCAAEGKYNEVNLIWTNVNHFSDLYGHWNDRLTWLDWLIKNSGKPRNTATYIQCLSRKGWTLVMMGGEENYREAGILLAEAWEGKEALTLSSQDYLAHNYAVLFIRQKNYAAAIEMLDQKESICFLLAESNICSQDTLMRHRINTVRDRAQIYFWEGDFEAAYTHYMDVLEKSQAIDWLRMVSYSNNMLAKILIEQGDLDEAENMLIKCMEISKRNRNKRRLAFCYATYADLEKRRNGMYLDWYNLAITCFQQLGMSRDSSELKKQLNLSEDCGSGVSE